MEQKQTALIEKGIIILKWILTGVSFIFVIASLTDKVFLSVGGFTLLTLLLLPPLKKFWNSKLPFLNNRKIKAAILFGVFIIGAIGLPTPDKKYTKSEKVESTEVEEFDEDEIHKSVTAFIDGNKNCLLIKNMEILTDCNNLFSEYTITKWSLSGVLILDEKTRTAIYQPFVGNGVKTEDFLKTGKKDKAISDYKLKFYFDNQNKVKKVEAIVSRGSISQVWSQNDSTDLSKLVLKDAVETQKEIVKEQNQIAEIKQKKTAQNDKFKEHCLSAWDGSCTALERYVKRNLKDPDSYEHIETTFMNMGDYAMVFLKYRAKNGFGGYTIEVAKAKVSWDCEVLGVEIITD